MLTLDQLRAEIEGARWFSRLGTYVPSNDTAVVIYDLELPEADDDWDWLPNSLAEEDPIHTPTLKEVAEAQGRAEELRRIRFEFHRLTLAAMRHADEAPLLRAQGGNYIEAAKRAALFAVRMAIAEILTGQEGFWCEAVHLYAAGYWPCGLDDRRRVVVL